MADQRPAPQKPERRLFGRGAQRGVAVVGMPRAGLSDVYHYLVTASWWQVIAMLGTAFLLVNTLFGTIYALLGGVAGAREGSFVDGFFFSVQTLATIGYGVMNPQTVLAHLVVTFEVMVGMLGMAMATGLVFAKFSRPRSRLMFSNRAVVSLREGVPTLMFRVANERQNHVVEATMRLTLLRTERTAEGEMVRRLHDLPLVRGTSPAFILTWTAMHQIVPGSPLDGVNTETLKQWGAELLVTILGIDESISQTIHARHAYVATDVLWGMRLADLMSTTDEGVRQIDYARFHDVAPAPATLEDAKKQTG